MHTLRQPIVQILGGVAVLLVCLYVLSKSFLAILFIILISAYVLFILFDVSIYRHRSVSESTGLSHERNSAKMMRKASLKRSVSSTSSSKQQQSRGPLTLNNSMNMLSGSFRNDEGNAFGSGSHQNRSELSKPTSSPLSYRSFQGNSGFQFGVSVSDSMNRSGRSFLTSPVTGNTPLSAGRSSELQLPRVRRMPNSSPSFSGMNTSLSGRPPIASHKRYPIHQPRYDCVGILPAVKLQSPNRSLISEQNQSLFGAVTVKVAPPDVLKPPIPIIIKVDRRAVAPGNTESVLTALREKRKRAANEEDEVQPTSPASLQVTKRRKQIDGESTLGTESNGGVGIEVSSRVATKRPADPDTVSEEEGEDQAPKRTRTTSGSSNRSMGSNTQQGTRNAIDISYSSSIRWREKQEREQSLSRSRESSISSRQQLIPGSDRATRSTSRDRGIPRDSARPSSRPVSRHNSPIRLGQVLRDLRDGDETMGEPGTTASTPVPCSSGRSTPISFTYTASDMEESLSRSGTPKKKLLLLRKEGSSKRRLAPPHSDLASSFSKVPQLRYSLTVEDFERDRHAEMERVTQMMNEVEQAHKEQLERKAKLKDHGAAATSLSAASSTSTTSVSSISTTTPGAAPLSAGFSLSSQSTASSGTTTSTTSSMSVKPLTTPLSLASQSSSTTVIQTTTTKPSSGASSQGEKASTTAPNVTGGFTFGDSIKPAAKPSELTTLSKPAPSGVGGFFNDKISGVAVSGPPASTTPVTVTLFSHSPATASSTMSSTMSSTLSSTTTSASTGMFSFGSSTKDTVPAAATLASSLPSYGAATSGTSTTFSTGSGLSLGGTKLLTTAASSAASPSAPSTTATAGMFGQVSLDKSTPFSSGADATKSATNDFLFGSTPTIALASSNSLSFGSTSLTGSKSSPNFGSLLSNPASQTASITPAFGFGSSQANPVSSSFKSQPASSTVAAALTFGSTNPTSVTPSQGLTFGAASTTSTGGAGFSFGKTEASKPSSTSSTFSFGQSASTNKPAAGGAFQFGQSAQNSAGSAVFGQPPKSTPSSAPGFGQSNTPSSTISTTGAASSFQFGSGTGPAKQPTPAGFQFGQTNAQKPAPTSSVFGSPATTGPFGSTSQNQPGSTGVFGSSNPSQGQGQGSVFGQSGGPSQSSFGSTGTTPGQGSFGGGSSQGSFSFGQQNPPSTSSQSANKGFNFGSSSTGGLPTPNFNFGGGGGQTPAANPTPAFSTPPNPNSSYGNQASGMFSIGQSNIAPQKRPTRTASRRGTRQSSRR